MKAEARSTFDTLIITGGSSGIGLGILQQFCKRFPSANCINISRTAPPVVNGAHISHIEADLIDRDQVEAVVKEIQQVLNSAPSKGRILLVNNSGIGIHERFQYSPLEDALRTVDLNISATVQLTHSLLPLLLDRGGSIVVVSSTSAFQPTPMMATYGASKAFLLNWTLALGEDLRDSNVSTLALCPGATETPFLEKAGFQQGVRAYWPLLKIPQVSEALFNGLAKGQRLVIPGWIDRTVAAISKTAPIRWSTRVAGHIMLRAKSN